MFNQKFNQKIKRLKRELKFTNNVLKNLFKPNAYQLRRRRQKKIKKKKVSRSESKKFSIFSIFDQFSKYSASRSSIKRGISPNQPWFTEPFMQAGNYLKKLITHGLSKLLGLKRSTKKSNVRQKESILKKNSNSIRLTPNLLKEIFEGRKKRYIKGFFFL